MSEGNQTHNECENTMTKGFCVHRIKKYWKDQKPSLDLNEPFTDSLFPPETRSLMSLDENDEPIDPVQYQKDYTSIEQENIEWKRASEILPECLLFEDKIVAGDIQQGSLGNCYFLSAIAAMTEFPNLIHKIFRTSKINPNGYYEIALFLDGEWQIVIIDDYLPYNTLYENSAFTRANGAEIWVLLLEKAWAKVNGGYLNIIGGLSCDPLGTLTGFHTRKVDTETEDIEELWSKLQKADKKNFIMCCDSKNDEEGQLKNIVRSHAYTLIGAQEENYKGELIRLCKIRNPWGNKEWNGDWSDNSDKWDDYLKEKFGMKKTNNDEWNDGTFFISVEDLTRYFSLIHICSYMYGSRTKTFEINKQNFRYPSVFSLYIPEKKYFSISTHGQHWRFNRHLKDKDIPISIILGKVDEKDNLTYIDSGFSSSEDPYVIRVLEEGNYVVWVYYGVNDDKKRLITDFNLKICGDSQFKAKPIGIDKDFKVLEKILLNGIKEEKKSEIEDNPLFLTIESSFKNSGFGYFIINNQSEKTHIKSIVKINEQEGYLILPPYYNKDECEIYGRPKSSAMLLGMKTRDNGTFWFNIEEETVTKNSKFKEDKDPKSKRESLVLYDPTLKDVKLTGDYYQFISPTEEEAKTAKQFEKLDRYSISLNIMQKKYPEKMQKVLELPEQKERKEKVEWKKLLAGNGYYICELNEKNGIEGRAIFTFNDNSFFIGTFVNGKKNGYFEEYSENGTLVFKGNYKDGKKSGEGFYYFDDGSRYEGNFEDDEKKGKGTFYFAKGAKYQGDFENNNFHGMGRYYFKENEYWDGPFIKNKKHGKGVYTFSSGKTKSVTYDNNKPAK